MGYSLMPTLRTRTWLAAREESGVVAVEFIFLLPVFLLIVTGIVEFGHLWYVQHVITSASRVGARAAVVYIPEDRSTKAPQIAKDAVDDYFNNSKLLPGSSSYTKEVTNVGGYITGNTVTVTVTAPGQLLLMDKFIPSLKSLTLTGSTTMRLE